MLEEALSASLKSKIKHAPTSPGCYLYRDKYGYVIYVGKAKNLKKRVSSYFVQSKQKDEKLAKLLLRIQDVEYQLTNSELDALILEYFLIKKYKPWFNKQMKADKPRPYLRIGQAPPYPTLSVVQHPSKDDAEYYDIFIDEKEIKAYLSLFGAIFGTAQCGKIKFSSPISPCLNYSLGKCSAPCAGKADKEKYAQAVEEIRALLQQRAGTILAKLTKKMERSANELDFEAAAQLKEQIFRLNRLKAKAKRMYHYPENSNILVLISPYRATNLTLFAVQNEVVVARFEINPDITLDQLNLFAEQWNHSGEPDADSHLLATCLTEILANKVFVRMPEHITGKRLQKEVNEYLAELAGDR